jgi:hypothetical protein
MRLDQEEIFDGKKGGKIKRIAPMFNAYVFYKEEKR